MLGAAPRAWNRGEVAIAALKPSEMVTRNRAFADRLNSRLGSGKRAAVRPVVDGVPAAPAVGGIVDGRGQTVPVGVAGRSSAGPALRRPPRV